MLDTKEKIRQAAVVTAHDPFLARRALDGIVNLRLASDLKELDAIVAPLFADLGFPHFGSGRFFDAAKGESSALLHGRLPTEWVKRYAASSYALRSPIAREMLRTGTPYRWSGVMRKRSLDKAGRRILQEARDFGLRDGLNIPLRGADLSYKAVVLSGPRSVSTDPFVLVTAELLATHYGREGIRHLRAGHGQNIFLTARQRECLLWVREGKSSSIIAELLGLSAATVNEHIAGACSALGVRTRIQAAMEATKLGLLDS